MSDHFEKIHLEENDPKYNMPYTPAIKVNSGKLVFLAGVTAAPIYHSHPHIPAEFDHIPEDPEEQGVLAMENVRRSLQAAGGDLQDIVQLFRFIKDEAKNQNGVNRAMARYMGDHRAASTSVEVVRLATDPRLVVEIAVVAVVPE
jgi:2-iminobutanoate/2-iminopropanoate deaminase